MRSAGFERQEYPLGAIAAYGPDSSRATKLVVSIFKRPGRDEADEMREWVVDAGDVRADTQVAAEVADWLRMHQAQCSISSV